MHVSPQTPLPLVWDGADPSDASTLFVQAVVRNAATHAVLKTLNLTDNGSQLFTASYTTPADPSRAGDGLHIIVTYTVYTDAGYSVTSPNYSRVTERFMVRVLPNNASYVGGGSWDNASLIEAVKKILEGNKPQPMPTPPDRTQEVLDAVEKGSALATELGKKVDAIKFPDIPAPVKQSFDLAPVHTGLRGAVGNILRAIKLIPAPKGNDDVLQAIATLAETQKAINEQLSAIFDNGKMIGEQFASLAKTLEAMAASLKKVSPPSLESKMRHRHVYKA